MVDTGGRPLAQVPEQRRLRHVAPDVASIITAPRENDTVGTQQRDGAVGTDIELAIIFRKIGNVDCHQYQTSKTSVQVVEAARGGDDPLPAWAAYDRATDQRATIARSLMSLEVVAVAVVEAGEVDVFSCRKPATGFIVDENTPNTLRRGFAELHKCLDSFDCSGFCAIRLQPIDQSDENGVSQFKSVVGMLRQRTRKIGHIHFCIL